MSNQRILGALGRLALLVAPKIPSPTSLLTCQIVLRLDLETKLSESLQIEFLRVRPQDKQAALLIVLGKILKREAQTIVFASTRHHVEMLYALLLQVHAEATALV